MAVFHDLQALDFVHQHPLVTIGSVLCLWTLVLVTYRVFFHPLSKFPGPRLAAATYWYETYHDVWHKGDYTSQIGRLHEKYGPIIRINPDELHVNDPYFIDTLYPGPGKKRDIPTWWLQGTNLQGSHFGTEAHDLHRERRGALNRFFSRATVVKLEPLVKKNAIKLCQNLETNAGSESPLDAANILACFGTEVIMQYMFDRSYGYLDDPKFKKSMYKAIHRATEFMILFRHFRICETIVLNTPDFIMEWLDPDVQIWRSMRLDTRKQIRTIKKQQAAESLNDTKKENDGIHTIFHEILQSNLPPAEKTTERLGREAQAITGAGLETLSWSLSVDLYHILSTPRILQKLRAELLAAMPDMPPLSAITPADLPSWTTLEQLPYLNACIHEGLRLSYGLATRISRSAPTETLTYTYTPPGATAPKTFFIPPGTPVSMTSVHIHHDPRIFPDSDSYIPERWLGPDGKRERPGLERYLLSFSKGTRQCLGINLAYAELFIGLASLIRFLGDRLELFETTKEDVRFYRDDFVPGVKPGSKGVRVLVK
ncbi:uncharacterized protein K452DRAFT_291838 [Aplosporella prunicola CBS 121167]|uniref:Cytochrome P450 n=1 Tax=Aplosporella prunicola CBS 121167 TaxID=1176127 RepID=A0A6A6B167_9PEZI|nr:uncharacterized protein K452DRAFT_291838 [Aplosporella prunicola CBS 121167]KAF2137173.1 hypothetical protein K452DRAFT_291838 [Aplosporella prunicola CBS 121167]